MNIDQLQAERDELARALLCERGEEEGAPSEWEFCPLHGGFWVCADQDGTKWRVFPKEERRGWYFRFDFARQDCFTALEAMRQCDTLRARGKGGPVPVPGQVAPATDPDAPKAEPDTPDEAVRILREGGYEAAYVWHGDVHYGDSLGPAISSAYLFQPAVGDRAVERRDLSWPDSARKCLALWMVP